MTEQTGLQTDVTEVADRIFRISTFVPDAGMVFNQYLVDAEEPLLFHLGQRALFPLVSEAVATVRPVADLRWLAFGHLEPDECGSVNQWLGAASGSQVVGTPLANAVNLDDVCDRAPRALPAGEVLDLGGRRVRHIETPHVPHGWDARVLYEEVTGTLLCGDLFTMLGPWGPTTNTDILGATIEAEDAFGYTALAPATGTILRGLADLSPTTLGLMHGPAYTGDAAGALRALGDHYDARAARLVASAA
jgi:flavorubredoxin